MPTRPDTSQVARFSYNPRSMRYKDRQSGRFVAAKDVRAAVDTVITAEAGKIRDVAQQLRDGKINLPEWQLQTAALVKNLHVAMAVAANGGMANTSASDLGFIGNQVKEQYRYLNRFAVQVKRGEQQLDGTLLSRAELYVQAARSTYEDMVARNAKANGRTQEKSILGAADHCQSCVAEAAKGWSPIGSLVPIGERTCMQNCHCQMMYR